MSVKTYGVVFVDIENINYEYITEVCNNVIDKFKIVPKEEGSYVWGIL